MKESIINQKNFDVRARLLNSENEKEKKSKERAEKSPYRNFVQLNRKNINHIIRACSENKQAVRVLLFIIEYMGKSNTLVCPYSVFKEHLQISQPTVNRSITYLEKNGFIQIRKSGRANKYIVNSDLVWGTKASNLPYCEYSGKELSAATEKDMQRAKKIKMDRSIDSFLNY